jgi:hypothetical protein
VDEEKSISLGELNQPLALGPLTFMDASGIKKKRFPHFWKFLFRLSFTKEFI